MYGPLKPPRELWVTGMQEAGPKERNFTSPYGCTEEIPTGQGLRLRISSLFTATKYSKYSAYIVACWSFLSSRRQKMKGRAMFEVQFRMQTGCARNRSSHFFMYSHTVSVFSQQERATGALYN